MCCIVYKPKGVPMLDVGTLDLIHRCNRDGCGFVSTRHHFKTLNYKKFLSRVMQVKDDEECIIHFRLATHGSICKENCHPFSEKGVYFAHNGVLDINPIGNMTDSETAFRTKIYPIIERYGFYSEEVDRAIDDIIGCSKFALMYKGHVRLFGYYQYIDGIYYSNLRWIVRYEAVRERQYIRDLYDLYR